MLLYTLVYGAMPFDGSDFNKLRSQTPKQATTSQPINPVRKVHYAIVLLTL